MDFEACLSLDHSDDAFIPYFLAFGGIAVLCLLRIQNSLAGWLKSMEQYW